MQHIEIKTLSELARVSMDIYRRHSDIKVWLLYGEMGAGKTTFISQLLSSIGLSDAVSSPTFAIVNEYATPEGEAIYHLDCYRLRDTQEAVVSGLEEILHSGKWCLIEWPQVMEPLLWGEVLCIEICKKNTTRSLKVNTKKYE